MEESSEAFGFCQQGSFSLVFSWCCANFQCCILHMSCCRIFQARDLWETWQIWLLPSQWWCWPQPEDLSTWHCTHRKKDLIKKEWWTLTLTRAIVTFWVDWYPLDWSFEGKRPEVVGVHITMGDWSETHHVDLVLVAHYEVLGWKIRKVF